MVLKKYMLSKFLKLFNTDKKVSLEDKTSRSEDQDDTILLKFDSRRKNNVQLIAENDDASNYRSQSSPEHQNITASTILNFDEDPSYNNDFTKLVKEDLYLDLMNQNIYIETVIWKHCWIISEEEFFTLVQEKDVNSTLKIQMLLMWTWKTFQEKKAIPDIKSTINKYFSLRLIKQFETEDFMQLKLRIEKFVEDCRAVTFFPK